MNADNNITPALMPTYARLPISFTRGQGVWLWDADDQKYLDALGGIAVCALGHAHPVLAKALAEQATTLLHTSNIYRIPLQEQLAEKLVELSGMDNAFINNSGAEANETAIKIARLYGHQRKIDNPLIIVTDSSFHGRTLATLTATGNRKVQAGFEPLVQGFVRVPFNDLRALQEVAARSPNVVAILIEPIQGEGGIQVPDDAYLDAVRELCNAQNWLMMLDEIQTGLCRTGKWFAFQHSENAQPDVMTLAKALGNGIPIGACLARGKAASVFQPGNHGSTFGGNPFACRAALTVLQIMQQQSLAERAAQLGSYIRQQLTQRFADETGVTDIRGKGMMLGIELDRPCKALVNECLNNKLLINVTAENTIRLLPPLIMTDQEATQCVDILSTTVTEFLHR